MPDRGSGCSHRPAADGFVLLRRQRFFFICEETLKRLNLRLIFLIAAAVLLQLFAQFVEAIFGGLECFIFAFQLQLQIFGALYSRSAFPPPCLRSFLEGEEYGGVLHRWSHFFSADVLPAL
ncbi:MAG: hypothetical protein ACOX45_09320 [Acutalibacteraceae bacterium]